MSYAWDEIESILNNMKFHKCITIKKSEIPLPIISDGFRESSGEPEGQLRDIRKTINGTECMHVKQYRDHYKVHRDRVDPICNLVMHFILDAPEVLAGVIGAIVAGLGFGKRHYKKVNNKSEHPLSESAIVTIFTAVGIGILIYLFVKLLRESLE